MRKPALTLKVLNGLHEAMHFLTAGDLADEEASGNITSADDVLAAASWLRGMHEWRKSRKDPK